MLWSVARRWRVFLAALIAVAVGLAMTGCGPPRPQAPSSAQIFYPPPPASPRIQYLTAINGAWDVVPPRLGLARLVFGKGDERTESKVLQRPYGIAAWEGKLYVCDTGAGDVKVFDLNQRAFYHLDGRRAGLSAPTNLCIDDGGYKFIVEPFRKRIHAYGPDDQYVTSFVIEEGRPADCAAVGDELFVTDITGHRLLVLDRSTGKVLRTLGGKGGGAGQFSRPTAVSADANGSLYLTDLMNFRFQKVSPSGTSLLVAGRAGDAYGGFARPRGIAVGPDRIIYVVESVYEVVQMFDQEGRVLMAFGHSPAAAAFLELPAGIATDTSCMPYFEEYIDPRFEADYLVFVVSQVGKARIGVYAFGRLKPGAQMPAPPKVPKRRPADRQGSPAPPASSPPTPGGQQPSES
jgi:sugar lactone lactonase YvrE